MPLRLEPRALRQQLSYNIAQQPQQRLQSARNPVNLVDSIANLMVDGPSRLQSAQGSGFKTPAQGDFKGFFDQIRASGGDPTKLSGNAVLKAMQGDTSGIPKSILDRTNAPRLDAATSAGTDQASNIMADTVTPANSGYTGIKAQIANWARQGGFSNEEIPMAVAIAMAESGGQTGVSHKNADKYGSTDWGVWQINDHWHRDKGTPQQWKDPVTNARVAKRIFDDAGKSWKPWSTYNNKAYSNFFSQPVGGTAFAGQSGLQKVKMQPFAATASNGSVRAAMVHTAEAAIGVPYAWGGNSLTKGVDCSGLVQQVYKKFGINLPRRADEQAHVSIGHKVAINQLKPGDLVAWQGGYRGDAYVGHIAIYAGNGQIIEAPDRNIPVRRRSLKPNENVFGVAISGIPG